MSALLPWETEMNNEDCEVHMSPEELCKQAAQEGKFITLLQFSIHEAPLGH